MITATTSPLSVRGSRTIASSSSRHCQLERCGVEARRSTLPSAIHVSWFLPAIISHAVWLYFRFALHFRNVEDMRRAVTVSYESSWTATTR
jgi:hypothetical protein